MLVLYNNTEYTIELDIHSLVTVTFENVIDSLFNSTSLKRPENLYVTFGSSVVSLKGFYVDNSVFLGPVHIYEKCEDLGVSSKYKSVLNEIVNLKGVCAKRIDKLVNRLRKVSEESTIDEVRGTLLSKYDEMNDALKYIDTLTKEEKRRRSMENAVMYLWGYEKVKVKEYCERCSQDIIYPESLNRWCMGCYVESLNFKQPSCWNCDICTKDREIISRLKRLFKLYRYTEWYDKLAEVWKCRRCKHCLPIESVVTSTERNLLLSRALLSHLLPSFNTGEKRISACDAIRERYVCVG